MSLNFAYAGAAAAPGELVPCKIIQSSGNNTQDLNTLGWLCNERILAETHGMSNGKGILPVSGLGKSATVTDTAATITSSVARTITPTLADPAVQATLVGDTFTRTVTPGGATSFGAVEFGTKPQQWATTIFPLNSNNATGVDGTSATSQNQAATSTRRGETVDIGQADYEVVTAMWVDALPVTSGALIFARVYTRVVDNANGYHVSIFVSDVGVIKIRAQNVIAGVSTNLASDVQLGTGYVANDVWLIRVRHVGSHFQARGWKQGTVEPTTWHYDTTDTNFTTQTIMGIGVTGNGTQSNIITAHHDYVQFMVPTSGMIDVVGPQTARPSLADTATTTSDAPARTLAPVLATTVMTASDSVGPLGPSRVIADRATGIAGLFATFEGGTNGDQITSTLWRPGETPFNAAPNPANTLISNSFAARGANSFAFTEPNGGTLQVYVGYQGIGNVTTAFWGRAFFYFPTTPSSSIRIVRYNNSSGTQVMGITAQNLANGGNILLRDGTNTTVATLGAMPTGQWVRMEWYCVPGASTGQAQLKVWTANPFGDGTPDMDSGLLTGLSLQSSMDQCWMGIAGAPAAFTSSWTGYADEVEFYSSVGWIGSGGITDTILPDRILANRAASDTAMTATDSPGRQAGPMTSDTANTTTESVARNVGSARGVSDTAMTATDSPQRLIGRGLADTAMTATDTIMRGISRAVSDTIATQTDAVGTNRARAPSDTAITQSDAVARYPGRAITDTGATITTSLVTLRSHAVSDTAMTATDSAIGARAYTRTPSDTAQTASDSVQRLIGRLPADTAATITDSPQTLRSHALADTAATITSTVTPNTGRLGLVDGALQATLIGDTFTRTISAGALVSWGSPEYGTAAGQQWGTAILPLNSSNPTGVDGTTATALNVASGSSRRGETVDIGQADYEVLTLCALDALPVTSGANAFSRIYARIADSSNMYSLGWFVADTGVIKLRASSVIAAVSTNLVGDVTLTGTYTAGDQWWTRVRHVGTHLQMRAWKAGTVEPQTWQIDTTDSNFTTQTVMGLGLTGNGTQTNSITIHIDSAQFMVPVSGMIDSVQRLVQPSLSSTAATISDSLVADRILTNIAVTSTAATITSSILSTAAPSSGISDYTQSTVSTDAMTDTSGGTAGMGSDDSGYGWADNGPATSITKGSGTATIVMPPTGATTNQQETLPDLVYAQGDHTLSFDLPAAPVGSGISIDILALYNRGALGYAGRVTISPSLGGTLSIRNSGGQLASVSLGALTTNQKYWMRFRAGYGYQTIKFWKDGQHEPSWTSPVGTLSWNDTAVTAQGSPGFRVSGGSAQVGSVTVNIHSWDFRPGLGDNDSVESQQANRNPSIYDSGYRGANVARNPPAQGSGVAAGMWAPVPNVHPANFDLPTYQSAKSTLGLTGLLSHTLHDFFASATVAGKHDAAPLGVEERLMLQNGITPIVGLGGRIGGTGTDFPGYGTTTPSQALPLFSQGSGDAGLVDIVAGVYDSWIKGWATAMKAVPGDLFIRLWREPSPGHAWGTSTYAHYIAAWQRAAVIFKGDQTAWTALGISGQPIQAENCTMLYCVGTSNWFNTDGTNGASYTSGTANYPGDSYVDALGVDGYGRASSFAWDGANFRQHFQTGPSGAVGVGWYDWAKGRGKPLLGCETGAEVDPNGVNDVAWVNSIVASLKLMPEMRTLVLWGVTTGFPALTAYGGSSAVQSAWQTVFADPYIRKAAQTDGAGRTFPRGVTSTAATISDSVGAVRAHPNVTLDTGFENGACVGGLGFDSYGVTPNTAVSIDSGTAKHGSAALRCAGRSAYVVKNIYSDITTIRFYLKPNTLPHVSSTSIIELNDNISGYTMQINLLTTGKLRPTIAGANGSNSTTSLVAGTGYWIDVCFDSSSSTWSISYQISDASGTPIEHWDSRAGATGPAYTRSTDSATPTPNPLYGLRQHYLYLGPVAGSLTDTPDYSYDDVRATDSAASYPIGPGDSSTADNLPAALLVPHTQSWVDYPNAIQGGILFGENAFIGNGPNWPMVLCSETNAKANRKNYVTHVSYNDVLAPPHVNLERALMNGSLLGHQAWPIIDIFGFGGSTNNWPTGGLADFTNGLMDSVLDGWISLWNSLPTTPFLIRLFHEMNLNGTIYGANGAAHGGVNETTSSFIAAWQYIVGYIRARCSWARFIWCPGGATVTNYAQWYPGDSYVDWTGTDIYTAGGLTPTTNFAAWYAAFNPYTGTVSRKPAMVCETGVDAKTTSLSNRITCVQDYANFATHFPGIPVVMFWDAATNNDPTSSYYPVQDIPVGFLPAYQTVVNSDPFLGVPGLFDVAATITDSIGRRISINKPILDAVRTRQKRGVAYLIIQRSDGTSNGTPFDPWGGPGTNGPGGDNVFTDTATSWTNLISPWLSADNYLNSDGTANWGTDPNDPALGKVRWLLQQAKNTGRQIQLRVPVGHWAPAHFYNTVDPINGVPDCGLTVDGAGGAAYAMPLVVHPKYRGRIQQWTSAIAALLAETFPDGTPKSSVIASIVCDAASDVGSEWPTTGKLQLGTNQAAMFTMAQTYGSTFLNADGSNFESTYGAWNNSWTTAQKQAYMAEAWSQQWWWGAQEFMARFSGIPILLFGGQVWTDGSVHEVSWTGSLNRFGGAYKGKLVFGRTNWHVTSNDGGVTLIPYGQDPSEALVYNEDLPSITNVRAVGGSYAFQTADLSVSGPFPAPSVSSGGSFERGVAQDLDVNFQDALSFEISDSAFRHTGSRDAGKLYQQILAPLDSVSRGFYRATSDTVVTSSDSVKKLPNRNVVDQAVTFPWSDAITRLRFLPKGLGDTAKSVAPNLWTAVSTQLGLSPDGLTKWGLGSGAGLKVALDQRELILGQRLGVVGAYVNWTEWQSTATANITLQLNNIVDGGRNLLVSFPDVTTAPTGWQAGTISGTYDSLYASFAQMLVATHPGDGQILVRLFWEMNINGNFSASDFIAAWRRVVGVMRAADPQGLLRFVWCPSVTGTSAWTDWWPGASYVDAIGMDGYNASPWYFLDQIWTSRGSSPNFDFYDTFKGYGLPMIHCETGTKQQSDPSNPSTPPMTAAQWYDAIAGFSTRLPLVKAVVIWDKQSVSGSDWHIDTVAGSNPITYDSNPVTNSSLNHAVQLWQRREFLPGDQVGGPFRPVYAITDQSSLTAGLQPPFLPGATPSTPAAGDVVTVHNPIAHKALADTAASISDVAHRVYPQTAVDDATRIQDVIAGVSVTGPKVVADDVYQEGAVDRVRRTAGPSIVSTAAAITDSVALHARYLVDQAAAITSSVFVTRPGGVSISESIGRAAVFATIGLLLPRPVSDTATTTSSTVSLTGRRAALSDTVYHATDTTSRLTARGVTDRAATTSDAVALPGKTRGAADTAATISDAVQKQARRGVTDTALTASDVAGLPTRQRLPADTATTISDQIGVQRQPHVASTAAAFSDTVAVGARVRSITDTAATVTDHAVPLWIRPTADTIGSFTDTILVAQRLRPLTDTAAAINAVLFVQRPRVLTDTAASFSDTTRQAQTHTCTDQAATITDSSQRVRSVTITTTAAAVTDSVAHARAVAPVDTVGVFTDTLKQTVIGITDRAGTFTDLLVHAWQITPVSTAATITDTVRPGGATRQVTDTAAALVDVIGPTFRRFTTDVAATISDTAAIGQRLAKAVADTATATSSSLTRFRQTAVADTAETHSDAVLRSRFGGGPVDQAATITTTIMVATARRLTDTAAAITSTLLAVRGPALTDTVTNISESLLRVLRRGITDTAVALVDTVGRHQFTRHLADTAVNFSELLQRQRRVSLSSIAAAISDAILRVAHRQATPGTVLLTSSAANTVDLTSRVVDVPTLLLTIVGDVTLLEQP